MIEQTVLRKGKIAMSPMVAEEDEMYEDTGINARTGLAPVWEG